MRIKISNKFFLILALLIFLVTIKLHKLNGSPRLKRSELTKHNEAFYDHPHNIRFRLLPKKEFIFNSNKILYISYVYINVKDFERRRQIRSSWANISLFPFQRNLFVLGSSSSEAFNKMIEYENKKHGDILQGNFLDEFKNMSSKSAMTLAWLNINCKNVNFYIKLKDNVEINPFQLYKNLTKTHNNETYSRNYLLCDFKFRPKVDRKRKSKFYVVFSEYNKYYYNYKIVCSEEGYVINRRLATAIFYLSYDTAKFWIDDVYVASLFEQLDINVKRLNFVTVTYEKFELLNLNSTLFYKHEVELTQDFIYAWSMIKKITKIETK